MHFAKIDTWELPWTMYPDKINQKCSLKKKTKKTHEHARILKPCTGNTPVSSSRLKFKTL
jgi:hypothetical protein